MRRVPVLLLGDPQQLPQVSTGVHPYPVDVSALGWLSDGAAALDPHFGYFLGESWRMDSALCERVSWLSYDGALASAAATAGRACRVLRGCGVVSGGACGLFGAFRAGGAGGGGWRARVVGS